ncbi:ATP-binding protein [Hydrogenophaga sp.]|uniref:sensor histidine kinase n=1 Tax=Hydrogenophaga sp. TaxID=1904254 RepID=UPI0025C275A8|nr:ATP-binding protein [Hydrogenophaga sp.]
MGSPDILVVDDDVVVIQAMASHLKTIGRLRFATDGLNALRLMRESVPDLILLDAQMPGLTGFQLLDEKRADPRLADVPVIMITNLSGEEHEQMGLEKGAADFLAKPVNPSILRARVLTQLRLAHANSVLKRLSVMDRLNLAAAMEELRASNANLQKTVDELAATNGRLSQFVRIASHDLREPLNTVDQFAGLIEEDDGPNLSDSGRQYLRLVRKAGARMRTLLDDVVNYAQLDVDLDESMTTVSLQTLMEDLRDALAARLDQTRAVLVVEPLPEVVGHGSLLAVVFQNLLTNGLKFVGKDQPPSIHVSSTQSDEDVVIEFRDNGIGIHPEDQARIFEPFVRLSRKQEFDGTGLGLTQARKIIEAHGGTLSVSSRPAVGPGTTFKVVLPKRPLSR